MSDDRDDEDGAETAVRVLLAEAGLAPPAEEVARLAQLYPGLRRTVDRFHEIDAGDEVPAAVYRADDDRPTPGADR